MVERRASLRNGHVAVKVKAAPLDRLEQLEVLSGRPEQLVRRLLQLAQSSLHVAENGQNEPTSKAEQGPPLFQRAAGLHRGRHSPIVSLH